MKDLIIQKRVEDKKKLFRTTRLHYIKFIVKKDYSLPEVIVNEKEFEIINKAIKEYTENKEVLEKFKYEFINNNNSIYDFFWHCKFDADAIQKNIKRKIKGSIFIYVVLDMYCKIKDSKSINEIIGLFKKKIYIEDLMVRTMVYPMKRDNGFPMPVNERIKFGSLMFKMFDINESYLYEYYKDKNSIYQPNNDENFLFCQIYMIAFSFIRLLIICRNQANFINKKELHSMFSNLSKDINLETDYIVEKLYPLYLKFYKDTFIDEYSIKDFYSFIETYNKKLRRKDLMKYVYGEEINQFNNYIKEELSNFTENTLNNLNNGINEFLTKLDKDKYFDLVEIKLGLNDDNIKAVYVLFYNPLFGYLYENMPEEVFYKLLDEDYWVYIDLLCDIHISGLLDDERNRLLEGNMEKESQYINEKFCFENINTGYEFETYLKMLFEGLGYGVEVTTKSNDQGADLIMRKNGEIIVVQAKYYSSQVGNKAIQEVVASISYYNADKGMVVTNNVFTEAAIELANANNIILIDGQELDRMRKSVIEGLGFSC